MGTQDISVADKLAQEAKAALYEVNYSNRYARNRAPSPRFMQPRQSRAGELRSASAMLTGMIQRMILGAAIALSLTTTGCGDSCADLAELCQRCPDDANGAAAKESCRQAVATADEATCTPLVEERHYAQFGCE